MFSPEGLPGGGGMRSTGNGIGGSVPGSAPVGWPPASSVPSTFAAPHAFGQSSSNPRIYRPNDDSQNTATHTNTSATTTNTSQNVALPVTFEGAVRAAKSYDTATLKRYLRQQLQVFAQQEQQRLERELQQQSVDRSGSLGGPSLGGGVYARGGGGTTHGSQGGAAAAAAHSHQFIGMESTPIARTKSGGLDETPNTDTAARGVHSPHDSHHSSRRPSVRQRPTSTGIGSASGGAAEVSTGDVQQRALARLAEAVLARRDDSQSGSTLLHWAVYAGCLPSAQLLVHFGAPLDARDRSGKTPLHWAAFEGHYHACVYLLGFAGTSGAASGPLGVGALSGDGDGGVDPIAEDEAGLTPCHLALMGHHEDVARLFPNYATVSRTLVAPLKPIELLIDPNTTSALPPPAVAPLSTVVDHASPTPRHAGGRGHGEGSTPSVDRHSAAHKEKQGRHDSGRRSSSRRDGRRRNNSRNHHRRDSDSGSCSESDSERGVSSRRRKSSSGSSSFDSEEEEEALRRQQRRRDRRQKKRASREALLATLAEELGELRREMSQRGAGGSAASQSPPSARHTNEVRIRWAPRDVSNNGAPLLYGQGVYQQHQHQQQQQAMMAGGVYRSTSTATTATESVQSGHHRHQQGHHSHPHSHRPRTVSPSVAAGGRHRTTSPVPGARGGGGHHDADPTDLIRPPWKPPARIAVISDIRATQHAPRATSPAPSARYAGPRDRQASAAPHAQMFSRTQSNLGWSHS